MQRIFRTFLLWTLILCACSPGGLSPQASSSDPAIDTPSPVILTASTTQDIPLTKLVATLATPHIEQPPDGNLPNTGDLFPTVDSSAGQCAYQWAYEDLPDLSRDFQQSIQQIQAEAQASAFAFGENCVHADGSADFIPMETDFNTTLQVTDLSNEDELGAWIVKVMEVIENIPRDQIVGPRPGRVSIEFRANDTQMFVNFYVDQYQSLPAGLSNAEIYQALRVPQ
jgi:hypothetical protein